MKPKASLIAIALLALAAFYLQVATARAGVPGVVTYQGRVNVSGSPYTGSDSLLQIKGMVRMGSETGTTEAPDKSVLVRRIKSTVVATGQIVARTDTLTLERDGTAGGLLIHWSVNPGGSGIFGNCAVSATGVTTGGAVVSMHNALAVPARLARCKFLPMPRVYLTTTSRSAIHIAQPT
jgi:hypothetical protein